MGSFFSKTFNPTTDMPNLNGRIAIVTGANAGLGFQTALQLVNHGAKVYIGARTEAKGSNAIQRLEEQNSALRGSGRLVWLPLDLSSIKKSKEAAEIFLAKESKLDILVNNAGIAPTPFTLTEEGFSENMAANHLGHFIFTITLLPVLNATSKLKGSDVRVINVSSGAYSAAPAKATFETAEDFKDTWAPPKLINSFGNMMARYGLSKLANILFTKELQRRWDAQGIMALTISLNPGGVATEGAIKMWQDLGPIGWLVLPFLKTSAKGAITSLFAATSVQVKAQPDNYKAQYLVSYGKIEQLNEKASDPKLASQLWETTEKVVADILDSNN